MARLFAAAMRRAASETTTPSSSPTVEAELVDLEAAQRASPRRPLARRATSALSINSRRTARSDASSIAWGGDSSATTVDRDDDKFDKHATVTVAHAGDVDVVVCDRTDGWADLGRGEDVADGAKGPTAHFADAAPAPTRRGRSSSIAHSLSKALVPPQRPARPDRRMSELSSAPAPRPASTSSTPRPRRYSASTWLGRLESVWTALFDLKFEEPALEREYVQATWHTFRPAALASAIFMVVSWPLLWAFIPVLTDPYVTGVYIAGGAASVIFLVPLVYFNVPLRFPNFWQVAVFIGCWFLACAQVRRYERMGCR